MTTIPRDGICICGVPVIRHFDAQNRKISCEDAKGRKLDIIGWELVGIAQSDRDASKSYEIRKDPRDGTIGCGCPQYGFRSTCKHVERYIRQQREGGQS